MADPSAQPVELALECDIACQDGDAVFQRGVAVSKINRTKLMIIFHIHF
jgi:hypothetical protein